MMYIEIHNYKLFVWALGLGGFLYAFLLYYYFFMVHSLEGKGTNHSHSERGGGVRAKERETERRKERSHDQEIAC